MYNRLILPRCLSGRSSKIKRRWWDGEIKGYHRISDIAVYRIWWGVSWNCDVASSNWNRHISIYLVTIEVHWTRSPISINVSGSLVASISRRGLTSHLDEAQTWHCVLQYVCVRLPLQTCISVISHDLCIEKVCCHWGLKSQCGRGKETRPWCQESPPCSDDLGPTLIVFWELRSWQC